MTENTTALVVTCNENDADLLETLLDKQGHDVTTVTSLSGFDQVVAATASFDFALVDADGFSPEIWERCERLQREGVPFFVLSLNPDQVSAHSTTDTERPVLEKPIEKEDLLSLIESVTT